MKLVEIFLYHHAFSWVPSLLLFLVLRVHHPTHAEIIKLKLVNIIKNPLLHINNVDAMAIFLLNSRIDSYLEHGMLCSIDGYCVYERGHPGHGGPSR